MQNKELLCNIAGGLFAMVAMASFYPAGNIRDKVILRIGKVAITEYELEKNLRIYSTDFVQKNTHPPGSGDIKNWIHSFIDRTYFIADAYAKGYDTMNEVNKWVESMEHYVISKRGGLLDEKTAPGTEAVNKPEMQPAWYDQVKKEAQIKINPDVLPVLENHLKEKSSIRVFEKTGFASLLSATLFTYNVSGRTVNVPADRFMDYYNTLPIRKEIRNAEGLVFYIESMVYDAFAYRKAEELGITKEVKFVLDKENYKKNVIWASYETRELKSGITVPDDEIIKKYQEIKDSLVQPAYVVVSIYSFAGRRDALTGMMFLKNKQTDSIRAMKTIDEHRSIHYQDAFFSDSIRALVFSMKNNGMSMPVPFAGQFIVIVKESESGRRIKTLPEARNDIVKKIENEKLAYKEQACLLRLKTLYPIQDEIDYQKCLENVNN